MAKNDFDIDFDFEKEYGFNPNAILDSEYTDDDLDLSGFDDGELDLQESADMDFADYDLAEEPSAKAYAEADLFDVEPEDGLERHSRTAAQIAGA